MKLKKIEKGMGLVRGTIASYKQPNSNPICDVDELASILAENVGNVPERVGFGKACEIHLLAKTYIAMAREFQLNRNCLDCNGDKGDHEWEPEDEQ